MSNGASSVHKAIRTELENYIQSQYFGRLCHNKQLINSHFYRGVSELPYKLGFIIFSHTLQSIMAELKDMSIQ